MSGAGWQVGDVAVCVDESPCKCCGSRINIQRGAHYRVSAVNHNGFNIPLRIHCVALHFVGVDLGTTNHPGWRGVNAARFRKLKAPATEVAAAIRACRKLPAHSTTPVPA